MTSWAVVTYLFYVGMTIQHGSRDGVSKDIQVRVREKNN